MSDPILSDSLLSRLADYERRLVALERSPQLIVSSIKDGALEVRDSSNIIRVRVGKNDGDFDVTVFDATGANGVRLSTLAFGIQAASVAAFESTSSSSYVDLATVGPTLSNVVVGPSGRLIVQLSAEIEIIASDTNTAQDGRMSFAIAGPTGSAASDSRFISNALSIGAVGTFLTLISHPHIAGTFLVLGLSPGTYTVTAKYKTAVVGQTVSFSERAMIAQPF